MGRLIRFFKNWRRHLGVFSWLGQHTKPFIRSLMLLLLLNAITSATSVGLSIFIKFITDNATSGKSFTGSIWLYVALVLLSIIVGILLNIFGTIINERFSFGIRARVYDSVLKTCYDKISAYHSGDLVTRLTSDIDIVATGIAEVIPSVFSLLITFIIAFIAMAVFDLGLAVFVLVLAPIGALVSIFMGRKLRPLQVKVQESESAYKSSLQETIANLVVVKAFDAQEEAGKRLGVLRNQRLYWLMKRQKIQAVSTALLTASFQFGYVAVIAWSAFRLSTQGISFGTMMMFLNLVPQIQAPLMGLSRMIPRLVSILASAGRVIEVEALPQEDLHCPTLQEGNLSLQVEDISFGYKDTPVLDHLDLSVEKGDFVALMGDSGIGKTTLIRLLMAYYQPWQGAIRLIDDSGSPTDITAGCRRYFAYVPQGNTLISGTIADNLLMGRPDATEAEMWDLLRVVAADDFISALPDGLHTPLGERGLGLSEGQAQRIAIARALIKNAPLLILDEATSALDEKTERAVLQHLQTHQPRPTCIIVTHRTSILPYCNRRIHIENGKIVESPMP